MILISAETIASNTNWNWKEPFQTKQHSPIPTLGRSIDEVCEMPRREGAHNQQDKTLEWMTDH